MAAKQSMQDFINRLNFSTLAQMVNFWTNRRGRNANAVPRLGSLSESEKWLWYEKCQETWKALISSLHPDRATGDGDLAAALNAAWHRTKELFARIGIGHVSL